MKQKMCLLFFVICISKMTIPSYAQLSVDIETVRPCFAEANGKLSALPSGGTPPYTYLWKWDYNSESSSDSTLENRHSSIYYLTVKDANNDSAKLTYNLASRLPYSLLTGTVCDNDSGIAWAKPHNYEADTFYYNWNTGSQNDTIYNLSTGVYSVTVIDDNGCSADADVNIGPPGMNTISGSFYDMHGEINLLRLKDNSAAEYVDTIISTGAFNYQFSDVPDGQYLLKATGDSVINPGKVSAYHFLNYFWQTADVVNVSCNETKTNIDLSLFEPPFPSGSNSISGYVKTPEGQPLEGIPVLTFYHTCVTLDSLLAITETDATGKYEITDINENIHWIYIFLDIPGLPMADYHFVLVPFSKSDYSGYNYIVDSNQIYKGEIITHVPATNAKEVDNINIYPNPVKNRINVDITKKANDCFIGIYDMKGKKLFMKKYINEQTAFEIDVSYLKSGPYIIAVGYNGKLRKVKKVMIE